MSAAKLCKSLSYCNVHSGPKYTYLPAGRFAQPLFCTKKVLPKSSAVDGQIPDSSARIAVYQPDVTLPCRDKAFLLQFTSTAFYSSQALHLIEGGGLELTCASGSTWFFLMNK